MFVAVEAVYKACWVRGRTWAVTVECRSYHSETSAWGNVSCFCVSVFWWSWKHGRLPL